MSHFLITGVAGFIGAQTARSLLSQGHSVVGVDNLNDYYDVRLKDHRLDLNLGGSGEQMGDSSELSLFGNGVRNYQNFTFIPGDIENRGIVEQLFESKKVDAVINLAARAGVRYSVEHPEVYASTNLAGSVDLLQAMLKYGVRKYVLASTSSLYAGAETPFVESANVTRPISPYAATKLAAEAMAHTYHHLHGIDVSIVRYFTVYGPAGRPDMSPLRFAKWIDEETPIILYGDGSQTRDFTYIDDIAAGTIAALKPVGYEIINLGGGNKPLSIREMINGFEKELGKKAIIDQRPFHAGDMTSTQANISKADRLLDWRPQVQPSEGLKRTVEWYQTNRSWLKDIQL